MQSSVSGSGSGPVVTAAVVPVLVSESPVLVGTIVVASLSLLEELVGVVVLVVGSVVGSVVGEAVGPPPPPTSSSLPQASVASGQSSSQRAARGLGRRPARERSSDRDMQNLLGKP
jgi:hypothetical protein